MKNQLLTGLFFLIGITSIHAGQSQLFPIAGLQFIQCCGNAEYSIDVKNINPTFAIENISGTWIVRRQNVVIHQETDFPRVQDLAPNTTTTFDLEIPVELLLLDGLLEIFFRFDSDFDLNPDPTKTRNAEVTGCGMTREEIVQLLLDIYLPFAEENDAYIFLYDQLLKPGTIVRGSGRDSYSTAAAAFTWMAMIYNPFLRFEQPVTVVLADANTGQTEEIDANWPPIIFDVVYSPEIDDSDNISGAPPILTPTPVPFTYTSVSSMPADSVCAILVAGIDVFKPTMQESFDRDLQLMFDYLNSHPNGPRIPESNILIREVKNDYSGDKLLMDLANLQGKYKKVYFYYTGHGSQSGEMCLGQFNLDWLDYPRFANDLLNSGAKSVCVMVDACYSGSLIDAMCNHPNAENVDIEVITSSNGSKTSATTGYDVNSMNEYYGKYTSQFFWTVQNAANDKNRDGKVSLIEGHKTVIMNDFEGIIPLQMPLSKDMKKRTLGKYGQIIQQSATLQYGAPAVEAATITVLPTPQHAGVEIQSFDETYNFTITSPTVFGLIDWQPNALFGKPLTYAYVNVETENVDYSTFNYTWPTMPLCPSYDFTDPDQVYAAGIDYQTGLPLGSVHQQIQTPSPPDLQQAAIIVTGYHPVAIMQQALIQSTDLFLEDLVQEEYSEQWNVDNIIVQLQPSAVEMTSQISSLGGVNKVYFYYTGNMTNTGTLLSGPNLADGIDLNSLFEVLAAIDADEYKIFIDASYSGMAYDYLNTNNLFEGKKLDLFTSTNTTSPAYATIWVDDQMNMTGAFTSFTYHLLQQYGNPAYNTDGHEGVSFKESFNELFIKNPTKNNGRPIFDLQQPLNISVRPVTTEPAAGGEEDFEGLDLKVRFKFRSAPFNVTTSQELNSREQTSTSSDVFAISPSRTWTMEGAWEIDPSLKADLVFTYNEDIDVLSVTDGILGLVSRITPDQDWEAYYPSLYDDVAKTITAENVSGPREWAIARVREPVGIEDQIRGLGAIELYPNPTPNKIHITFDIDRTALLTIAICDLNGNRINTLAPYDYSAGEHTVELNLENLASGIYWVQLYDGSKSAGKPFIIK